MKVLVRLIYMFSCVSLLFSCSTTKFVGEGEYLLDNVRIVSDNKDYKHNDLKPYLRQHPNFKSFGLLKWQLYLYDWSGRNEKRWVNKQLRRIGEAPVILDTMLVNESAGELQRFMVNKGYVNASVSAEIDTTTKAKKAVVTYHVKANDPYRITKYKTTFSDAVIDSISRLKAPSRTMFETAFKTFTDDYSSLIQDTTLFDRDLLDQERQRLTTLFRRRGYYAFNKDYLTFLADTTGGNKEVDLEMVLRPYQLQKEDGTVIEKDHQQYYIKDVTIIAGYDPLTMDWMEMLQSKDSLKSEASTSGYLKNLSLMRSGNIDILYYGVRKSIRPSVLAKCNFIIPGTLFNEKNVEQTYAAYSGLRALRNVDIRFVEVMEHDTMKLNCAILTSPSKLQGFGVELEGTNSAGDFGFASSLNYQHRNLFRGSELFSAKIRGAYEALSRSQSSEGNSYWEFGAEGSILFPNFLFPFLTDHFKKKIRATTELKVSYSIQDRPEFSRSILSGGWSYIWAERSNVQGRHVFKLIDIDYVHLPKLSQSFRDNLPESTLLYNFTDQFIVGTGYNYSFSNYNPQNRLSNTHSLRFSFEMAGNFLSALSWVTKAEKNANGRYRLFGIDYAQFVKGDIDFSKSIVLDGRNKLAFHAGFGLGYPYGNSRMLPFERSYFSGGANSVRGWSVRSLGPGSMPIDSVKSFAQQVGDIRLDLNMEYRTKLFWKLEMAAFVDAGNVWTFHKQKDRPKGNFDFSRFYKEIAASYGLGIRLDFDFFLIRFDMGMKAYNPQESGNRKWALIHPKFKDDFAWHFAVGYPF